MDIKVGKQAIQEADQVVRDFPDGAEHHSGLAWLLCLCPVEGLRDPDRALVLAERAVALTPSGRYALALALAQHRRKDHKACLETLRQGQAANAHDERCAALEQRKCGK